MKTQLLLICLLGLLVSCSVQKRRYQNGFYVSWHGRSGEKALRHQPVRTEAGKRDVTARGDAEEKHAVNAPQTVDPGLYASSAPGLLFAAKQTTTGCDVVQLRRGEAVHAKVTEIHQDYIKYRRCEMPDGPVYTVKKSEVASIKYASGSEETFQAPDPEYVQTTPESKPAASKRRKLNGYAMTALLIPLFLVAAFFSVDAIFISFGLLLALSIALGAISIDQISRNQDTFGGGFAIAGMAISLLTLLVLLLAVALM